MSPLTLALGFVSTPAMVDASHRYVDHVRTSLPGAKKQGVSRKEVTGQVWVQEHVRRGKHVEAHWRSAPNRKGWIAPGRGDKC